MNRAKGKAPLRQQQGPKRVYDVILPFSDRNIKQKLKIGKNHLASGQGARNEPNTGT